MRSSKSRGRFLTLCVAPAVILYFVFMILPTLNVFRMSLFERGGLLAHGDLCGHGEL